MVSDLLPDARWFAVHRADPRLYALYRRHYSAEKNARWRRPGNYNSVAAGSPMCLLTVAGDAAFVWLKNTAERYDHQEGVCCRAKWKRTGRSLGGLLLFEKLAR